jgi:tetratricopeptide (TPR) repeat protein
MKKQDTINKIKELIEQENYQEALNLIDKNLEKYPDEPEFFLEKGKLLKHLQKFGDALNNFKKVLNIDPDHKEAKNLHTLVQDILRYQQLDIYSSTNLSNDPWLD